MSREERIYLDDAGSAPVLPEVRDALRNVPDGNPSSPHAEGRAARAALDRARDVAAAALGVRRTEVTFVASGTEAVNLALFGAVARLPKSGRMVTWTAEHQSVLAAVRRMQTWGAKWSSRRSMPRPQWIPMRSQRVLLSSPSDWPTTRSARFSRWPTSSRGRTTLALWCTSTPAPGRVGSRSPTAPT